VIRVVVAAARPTARAGLAAVLRTSAEIEVVGEAAGVSDVLALAASYAPDAALIELEAASDALGGAVAALSAAAPSTGVVLLSDADSAWSVEALRGGARGILSREAERAEIVAAVLAAAQGLLVVPAALARTLLPLDAAPAAMGARSASVEPLTARELEVLRLIGEGLGNKGIAQRLRISEHTVKFHVGAIMAKLGAASRTEAVTIAARHGLIML
jgi:DNA-binding NarL/FixJ family response regulator